MFKVNNHIVRKVINEYGGSEQKETVYLDDGKKYMIKKPDPTREAAKQEVLSYINNVYSEYISCHIAGMLGFEVQNTILGEYITKDRKGNDKIKIVCLCEDVRKTREKMHEFDTIALSTDINTDVVTFEDIEIIINHIAERLNLADTQTENIRNFYYDLFVFDAFVGNTDRHNGNVALLVNEYDNFSRISPIYDCGSTLLPLVDDSEIENLNIFNSALTIDSVIRDGKGKRIRYIDYFVNENNLDVDNAIKRMIPKINLIQIMDFIRNTDYISDERKAFYCNVLELRYEKVLIPALQRIFAIPQIECPEELNLYQIYKDNIRKIADLPLYEKTLVRIQNKELELMRLNKKYAICISDGECKALLPIRSNNQEVRKAIQVFGALGISFSNNINRMHSFDKADWQENNEYELDL